MRAHQTFISDPPTPTAGPGMRTLVLALAILFAAISIGCVNVKPWERDQLARRDMSSTPDPLDAALEAHIKFSKEASMPGGSAGGGGCGCN